MGQGPEGWENHVNAGRRLRHRVVFNGELVLWYCDQGVWVAFLRILAVYLAFSWCVFLVLVVPLVVSVCMVSEQVSHCLLGRVFLGCSYPCCCLGYWLGPGGL